MRTVPLGPKARTTVVTAAVGLVLFALPATAAGLAGAANHPDAPGSIEGATYAEPAGVVAMEIVSLPSLPNLVTVSHAATRLLFGPAQSGTAKGFYLRKPPSTATTPIPFTTDNLADALNPIPVVGSMYRRAGKRFNTADGSSVDAFAICYRMSNHVGFQLVPGDPAPVKLAVTSLANNTGVTVGMTWKLFRKR